MDKQSVLFICPHNSARSQMAAAFLNTLAPDHYSASCAGLEAGPPDQLAVNTMKEAGIDISLYKVKPVNEFIDGKEWFNALITICDEALAEKCPFFPLDGLRLNWNIPDPAQLTGTAEEKTWKISLIRDLIRNHVERFIRSQHR